MLNKNDFNRMRNEISKFDQQREEIIKKSRDILKSSKQAIYSVHRSQLNNAEQLLKKAKKDIAIINGKITKDKGLESIGAFSGAMQEFVEASCYHSFAKKKRIPTRKELGARADDYLMGLCDLTGELGRKAVAYTIKKEFKAVERIRKLVEEIYGEFLKFDFRNSELRKKSDAIKWNLKKIEEIMYDINLKEMKK